MNKKAINQAYDSHILAMEARKERQHRPVEEKDILEILRELSKSYRKGGFTVGEIIYVTDLLFVVRKPHFVYDILVLAEQRAKVVSLNGLWRIVESSGYGE